MTYRQKVVRDRIPDGAGSEPDVPDEWFLAQLRDSGAPGVSAPRSRPSTRAGRQTRRRMAKARVASQVVVFHGAGEAGSDPVSVGFDDDRFDGSSAAGASPDSAEDEGSEARPDVDAESDGDAGAVSAVEPDATGDAEAVHDARVDTDARAEADAPPPVDEDADGHPDELLDGDSQERTETDAKVDSAESRQDSTDVGPAGSARPIAARSAIVARGSSIGAPGAESPVEDLVARWAIEIAGIDAESGSLDADGAGSTSLTQRKSPPISAKSAVSGVQPRVPRPARRRPPRRRPPVRTSDGIAASAIENPLVDPVVEDRRDDASPVIPVPATDAALIEVVPSAAEAGPATAESDAGDSRGTGFSDVAQDVTEGTAVGSTEDTVDATTDGAETAVLEAAGDLSTDTADAADASVDVLDVAELPDDAVEVPDSSDDMPDVAEVPDSAAEMPDAADVSDDVDESDGAAEVSDNAAEAPDASDVSDAAADVDTTDDADAAADVDTTDDADAAADVDTSDDADASSDADAADVDAADIPDVGGDHAADAGIVEDDGVVEQDEPQRETLVALRLPPASPTAFPGAVAASDEDGRAEGDRARRFRLAVLPQLLAASVLALIVVVGAVAGVTAPMRSEATGGSTPPASDGQQDDSVTEQTPTPAPTQTPELTIPLTSGDSDVPAITPPATRIPTNGTTDSATPGESPAPSIRQPGQPTPQNQGQGATGGTGGEPTSPASPAEGTGPVDEPPAAEGPGNQDPADGTEVDDQGGPEADPVDTSPGTIAEVLGLITDLDVVSP